MRLRRALGALAVLALLAAAAAGAAAWWGWRALGSPYRGFVGEDVVVLVEPGTPSAVILRDLEAAGVLAHAELARAWLVYGMGDPPLQAGEYRFAGRSTPRGVLGKLVRGDVATHPVTVVEGLDLEEIAAVLAVAGLGEEDAFLAAMRDPSPIADWDSEAEDLEGYLFPSTYSFPRTTGEEEIVRTLVRTFRERWAAEVEPLLDERWGPVPAVPADGRTAAGEAPLPEAGDELPAAADPTEVEDAAEALDASGAGPDDAGPSSPRPTGAAERSDGERAGQPPAAGRDVPSPTRPPGTGSTPRGDSPQRPAETDRPPVAVRSSGRPFAGGRRPTVREVVTLASVVEKEAKIPDERPVIAGVYANRLARGIALYADPTVIFALKKLGRWDGNIRRADLRVDSPYNTYRYPGLPPGPIASPGLASLRAAAAPAEVDHLYFVSRNDGTHVFADTLAEHNRNVELWQKRYWRERRAAEGASGSEPTTGGPADSKGRDD